MADLKRAVYYTTDDNPLCIYRLRRSIRSLREFNQKIPVYVAYYGPLEESDRQFFQEQNVTLIYNPERVNPHLARFLVLENDFPESELAYLDTDTHVFGDIEELFEKTGPEDFHARNAPLTERDGYPRRRGLALNFKSIVNYEVFDYICKTLNLQCPPFFNIGLLVFKNNFHIRLRSYFQEWTLLQSMFETKQLPYPCQNPNVSREMVTPMVFAGIPNFSWSYIDPGLSAFYIEYRGERMDTGVVMHIFSPFYYAYLLDFAGKEELFKYSSIRRKKSARLMRRAFINKIMPLGGSVRYRSVFMRKIIHAWIRMGGRLYRYHVRKRANVQQMDQISTHAAQANSLK